MDISIPLMRIMLKLIEIEQDSEFMTLRGLLCLFDIGNKNKTSKRMM